MQGLASSDARNWAAVAAIHGTAADGFIWCQHGNDHFFDWHRGYLLNFERICQKLTGDKNSACRIGIGIKIRTFQRRS